MSTQAHPAASATPFPPTLPDEVLDLLVRKPDLPEHPKPKTHIKNVVTATVLKYASARRSEDEKVWMDALLRLAQTARNSAGKVTLPCDVGDDRVKQTLDILQHEILLPMLDEFVRTDPPELQAKAEAGELRHICRQAGHKLIDRLRSETTQRSQDADAYHSYHTRKRISVDQFETSDDDGVTLPVKIQKKMSYAPADPSIGVPAWLDTSDPEAHRLFSEIALIVLQQTDLKTKLRKSVLRTVEAYLRARSAIPNAQVDIPTLARDLGVCEETVHRHIQKALDTFAPCRDPLGLALREAVIKKLWQHNSNQKPN